VDEKLKAELQADVAQAIKEAEVAEEGGFNANSKAIKRLAGVVDQLIKNA
jgi:hypothetical protein